MKAWLGGSASSPEAATFPASIRSSKEWSIAEPKTIVEVIGIRRGWEGLTHLNLDDPASVERYVLPLNRDNTRTIDRFGGTMLHSTRTNPSKMKKLPDFLPGGYFSEDGGDYLGHELAGAEEPGKAEASTI